MVEIHLVLPVGADSEVRPAIVAWIAVDVVHFHPRPSPIVPFQERRASVLAGILSFFASWDGGCREALLRGGHVTGSVQWLGNLLYYTQLSADGWPQNIGFMEPNESELASRRSAGKPPLGLPGNM